VPTLSFAQGIDASYEVAAGQTSVIITSRNQLKARTVYVGTGQMIFHWVSSGKSQAWRCDASMVQPNVVQVTEAPAEDGTWKFEVPLGDLFPAGFLLQGRMVGSMVAPAIHLDIPWWQDVWVFLVRSPWFPLNLQVDKAVLAVTHGSSRATASLNVSGRSIAAQVEIDGTDYKGASLVMNRAFGYNTSKEVVGEMAAGTESFVWKPISRAFDLLLVVHHELSEPELAQVAAGLGAEEVKGFFGPSGVEGDYVLCDGPAIKYSLSLKAHRGFMENDEDQADVKLTW
jgi:hypothetical protein